MKLSDSNVSRISFRFAAASALLLGLAGVSLPQTSQTNQPQKGAPSTAAIVFGVGSPDITANRSGTSIGIVAGGTVYLFDAGAGVVRRMMEAAPQLAALHVQKLGPVFITHLDMDHILGLAVLPVYNLIDSSSTLRLGGASRPRGGELTVYGPGPAKGRLGIREVMDHVHAAFFPTATADNSGDGIQMDGPFTDFAVRAIEITPGVVYRDPNVTVAAFTVAHKSPIAYGFRVQTSDRVIVISGDTSPVDAVVEACNGCDLLFHEMFGIDFGPGGPKGAAQGHTSAVELGEIARRARPKHLVIYHDVNYPSQQAAIQAIRKGFAGEVTFARDLDIF